MKTIISKQIDLSNYNEQDLIISGNIGSSLLIQIENISGSIGISGKNINAEAYTTISGISLADFSVLSDISENGIYSFDVSGFDSIKFNVDSSDTGSVINIKVVD